MTKRKNIIFFATILFFSLLQNSFADLEISHWQEDANITNIGKNSAILIQGRATNIPKDQAIASFSIGFDRSQNIQIGQVVCDSKWANYKFENNVLTINFPQYKKNSDSFLINFNYAEKYNKINKYLRQEAIYVPEFAANANAKVTINFPGYLDSATFNPNVIKNGNSFVYSNIVPKGGIREIIKLTPAQSIWDVNVKIKANGNLPLGKITVKMPKYFENGGQKVENFTINTSDKASQIVTNEGLSAVFETNQNQILIENKARITTGKVYQNFERNPTNYTKISAEEAAYLGPILNQIRSKDQNLPLYARIGKFVHEFIHYDLSYAGRLPDVKTILQNPVGVCTEYALLFNSLARLAGIPSLIINGAACGEYEKCMGHAWNMIYYNNQWLAIDATWNLMSGNVSSSHVYFAEKNAVTIEYQSNGNQKISHDIDFDLKNLQ